MGLAPLHTPVHTKPRTNKRGPNLPTIQIPTNSPPTSPTKKYNPYFRTASPRPPTEIRSPSPDNPRSIFSNPWNFTPVDLSAVIVKEVIESSSDIDYDEGMMIGPETMEAFTPFKKKKKAGWFAWAGVAIVGIVSGTIILASGQIMKESSDEKHRYAI